MVNQTDEISQNVVVALAHWDMSNFSESTEPWRRQRNALLPNSDDGEPSFHVFLPLNPCLLCKVDNWWLSIIENLRNQFMCVQSHDVNSTSYRKNSSKLCIQTQTTGLARCIKQTSANLVLVSSCHHLFSPFLTIWSYGFSFSPWEGTTPRMFEVWFISALLASVWFLDTWVFLKIWAIWRKLPMTDWSRIAMIFHFHYHNDFSLL